MLFKFVIGDRLNRTRGLRDWKIFYSSLVARSIASQWGSLDEWTGFIFLGVSALNASLKAERC